MTGGLRATDPECSDYKVRVARIADGKATVVAHNIPLSEAVPGSGCGRYNAFSATSEKTHAYRLGSVCGLRLTIFVAAEPK